MFYIYMYWTKLLYRLKREAEYNSAVKGAASDKHAVKATKKKKKFQ